MKLANGRAGRDANRVALDEDSSLVGKLLFSLHVVCDIAELLFHHSHGLKVSRCIESVTTEQQQLWESG